VALVRLLGAVGVGALVSVAGCAGDGEASRPSSTATTVAPVRVGRITTTITPEAMQLGDEVGIDLRGEVRETLERVDGLLQFDTDVAVEVVVDPARVIPDVGVGGSTDPVSGAVVVSLTSESPVGTERSLHDWLPAAVAHELDHSKRILEGPGYGPSLGEAIVSEGLADTFSLHAFPSTPVPPWTEAVQPEDLDQLITLARARATTTDTDVLHAEWFFGTGEIPRWAGYTIGTRWVDDYLATHPDVDIVDATVLPAHDIIPT
jgi:hypothetical protein